jgi:hypothetical protein
MFNQRYNINQNKQAMAKVAVAVGRTITASVGKVVFRAVLQPAPAAVPSCENGVCSLDWKPQRPAA